MGWQAAGMGSAVLGAGVLLVFAVTLPVFHNEDGKSPEPEIAEIVGQLVPTQSTDASATQQGQSAPAGDTAPAIPHGAPLLNLTYEGTVYYASALSADEAANLNQNGLELVGSTNESNRLLPAGSELRRFIGDLNHDNPELTLSEIKDRVEAEFQIGLDESTVGRTIKGLDIYKLKNGEEGYVYTAEQGQSHVNPEDGQIIEFAAAWMRWGAAD